MLNGVSVRNLVSMIYIASDSVNMGLCFFLRIHSEVIFTPTLASCRSQQSPSGSTTRFSHCLQQVPRYLLDWRLDGLGQAGELERPTGQVEGTVVPGIKAPRS